MSRFFQPGAPKITDASRVIAPRFPWERDPDPLIQELNDERSVLVEGLCIETDAVLMTLRLELIRSLEVDIDTMRKLGRAARRRQC